ncbi:2-keto-4-pentenoate hydratase [Ramlibacter sp. Leaf400]|uniref:2-keto-4-pentenoate hydratase n=1 Tax=Ramlibacter sp. Leaf400 TaxID=1736365 RepID=UPI00138F5E8F|nr:fumarylacetoacetate hydrolase family protein [Ramlibacter sp. Leaf400]
MASDWIGSLLQARRSGAPFGVHPSELQCGLPEAYALQHTHLQRVLQQDGDAVHGAKLSVTSAPALERLGLKAPLLGPILRGRSHASGVVLPRSRFFACILEAEIGFVLGADLDARDGAPPREAVADAIAAAFPCIEIADSRYAQWAEAPACAIVADLAYAGDWVRGTDCAGWRALDLRTLPVTLSRDGEVIREGSGDAVLGDPLHALALAATEAATRGEVLRAGTLLSTGACTAPWPAPGAGSFVAEFGPLGSVTLTLT